jgi:hypothetical protein
MLHELFALPHHSGMRFDSPLHPFQDSLICPAGDAAPRLDPCTVRLDRAGPTGSGGIVANISPKLAGIKSKGQRLAGWASVTILLGLISEALFPIESQLSVGQRQRFGNIGRKPDLFPAFDFLAMLIAHICHPHDPFDAQGLFGLERYVAPLIHGSDGLVTS